MWRTNPWSGFINIELICTKLSFFLMFLKILIMNLMCHNLKIQNVVNYKAPFIILIYVT